MSMRDAKVENQYSIKNLKNSFGIDFCKELPDDRYDQLLAEFQKGIQENDTESVNGCFSQLILGNDRQIEKLNYTLMIGKYNTDRLNEGLLFQPSSDKKIHLPVEIYRVSWSTYVKINTEFFPEGTIISFTSDIGQDVLPIFGVRPLNRSIEYTASDFGWLKGKRQARLFVIDKSYDPSIEGIKESNLYDIWFFPEVDIIKECKHRLLANEVAFFEDGEKEFSVEIGVLNEASLTVIKRYTIGGWNQGEYPAHVDDIKWL